MSKFWQKKYTSKYTGAEIDAAVAKAGDATKVTANPTLAGTEAALAGLQVGETKYKVDDNTFLVTVNVGDGASVTADKTYAEIAAAQTAGKRVIFKLDIIFFGVSVNGFTGSYLFASTGVTLTFVFYIMNGVKAGIIQLDSETGTWTYTQKSITTT